MTTEISTEISSKSDLKVVYDSLKIKDVELLPTIITVTFDRSFSDKVYTSITVTSNDLVKLSKEDVRFDTKLLELIKLILNKNYRLQVEFMPDDDFINLISDNYKLKFEADYSTRTISPKHLSWMDKNMVWIFGIDNKSLAIFEKHPGEWAYYCVKGSDIYNKMHKRLVKETLIRFFMGESFYDKIFRDSVS